MQREAKTRKFMYRQTRTNRMAKINLFNTGIEIIFDWVWKIVIVHSSAATRYNVSIEFHTFSMCNTCQFRFVVCFVQFINQVTSNNVVRLRKCFPFGSFGDCTKFWARPFAQSVDRKNLKKKKQKKTNQQTNKITFPSKRMNLFWWRFYSNDNNYITSIDD